MPEGLRHLLTAGAAGLVVTACTSQLAAADNLPSEQDFAQIERGRYLTAVADCAACHTDPDGGAPFAGGRPIETPFGVVIAANITPDPETGIGEWSDAQFDSAVRLGRAPGGKWLYPAMPFPYYTRMTQADVLAIRAYLNTLQPVHHRVESDQLTFPFGIRASMRLWDALYFNPRPYRPDPTKSTQWNRGGYLVQGPGHCAACHTPKTLLGGDRTREPLQGYSIQGWFAPDITDDAALGLGRWSAADIVAYLKTGHNRLAAAAGPMADEVSDSSSRMSDSDLEAIAVFLKSERGATVAARPLRASEPAMVAGAAIYRDLCSACHLEDGTGVAYLIPDLAQSSSVASREPTTVVRVVIHGAQSVATSAEPTGPSMPAFGWQLTDAQIAAVATYIRNSWGHAAPATAVSEVHKARSGS
jgi:mono/diheme cytochrome c family protein